MRKGVLVVVVVLLLLEETVGGMAAGPAMRNASATIGGVMGTGCKQAEHSRRPSRSEAMLALPVGQQGQGRLQSDQHDRRHSDSLPQRV